MDLFELQKLHDREKRNAYYIELHKQENLWKALYDLLSIDNKQKLTSTLKSLDVVPNKTFIIPINSNLLFYHATQNGTKPYIIVGYHNYTVYGCVNGLEHQVLETTGHTPNFYQAYNDVDYRDYMVVTFDKEREPLC